MSQKNKSAKDLAFEKERAKMRQEKRELEFELSKKLILARQQRDTALERAYEAEAKVVEQQEWIDRLLEFTDMSKEDIQIIIEENQKQDTMRNAIHNLVVSIGRANSIFGKFTPLQ